MECDLKTQLEQAKSALEFQKKRASEMNKKLDAALTDFEEYHTSTGKSFNDYVQALFSYNPSPHVIQKYERLKDSTVEFYNRLDDFPELRVKPTLKKLGLLTHDMPFHIQTAKELLGFENGSSLSKRIEDQINKISSTTLEHSNKTVDPREVISFNTNELMKRADLSDLDKKLIRDVNNGELPSYELAYHFKDSDFIFDYMNDLQNGIDTKVQRNAVDYASHQQFGTTNVENYLNNLKDKVNKEPDKFGLDRAISKVDGIWEYATAFQRF